MKKLTNLFTPVGWCCILALIAIPFLHECKGKQAKTVQARADSTELVSDDGVMVDSLKIDTEHSKIER